MGVPSADEARAGLAALIAEGALPATGRRSAETLVQRLGQPVRVALLGRPGAGRTTLANVLAGSPVLPADSDLPNTEVIFAELPGCTACFADGATRHAARAEMLEGSGATHVEVAVRSDALRAMTLVELATDGTYDSLLEAARTAGETCDIVVWVTRNFDTEEQVIWHALPDGIRDHGFLVLTQIDRLEKTEIVPRVKAHKDIAQAFHTDFFAVATRQALASVAKRTEREVEVFRASGAGAFADALRAHVTRGLQADVDRALMFLSRYGNAPESKTAAPAPEPDFGKPDPISLDGGPDSFTALVRRKSRPVSTIISRSARQAAMAHLRQAAGGMLQEMRNGDAANLNIVDQCVETVEEVSGHLSPDDPLRDRLTEAADVIVLLQVEKTDDSAEDAALVLLQLGRELEGALAA